MRLYFRLRFPIMEPAESPLTGFTMVETCNTAPLLPVVPGRSNSPTSILRCFAPVSRRTAQASGCGGGEKRFAQALVRDVGIFRNVFDDKTQRISSYSFEENKHPRGGVVSIADLFFVKPAINKGVAEKQEQRCVMACLCN